MSEEIVKTQPVLVKHTEVVTTLNNGNIAHTKVPKAGWSSALLAELFAEALKSKKDKDKWVTPREITHRAGRSLATKPNIRKTRARMCRECRRFLDIDQIFIIKDKGTKNQYIGFRVFDDTVNDSDKVLAERELNERRGRNELSDERAEKIRAIIRSGQQQLAM